MDQEKFIRQPEKSFEDWEFPTIWVAFGGDVEVATLWVASWRFHSATKKNGGNPNKNQPHQHVSLNIT